MRILSWGRLFGRHPLLLIIGVGLILRLFFAVGTGYGSDLGFYHSWMRTAVERGVGVSYQEQVTDAILPNYPPLFLILLRAIGGAYQIFIEEDLAQWNEWMRVFLKMPSVAADLLTAYLLYVLCSSLFHKRAGYLAAALYAALPTVWYDSAVWGQTDSLYTFFVLLALLLLWQGRGFSGGAVAATAVLLKAQALPFFPVLFLLSLRSRRLFLQSLLGGGAVLAGTFYPFALAGTLEDIFRVYADSVGYYPALSMNAYNLWHALFGDAAGNISDADLVWDLVSYRTIGLTLFVLVSILALGSLWRCIQGACGRIVALRSSLAALAAIAYAFFLLNTQMHERYLFPFLAFGLPFVFENRKTFWLYISVAAALFLNMLGVLPWTWMDRALFDAFPEFNVLLASMLSVFFVLWMCWTLRGKFH